MKCAGLTPEQLRERAVPPSNLSLLGLVRHLADTERKWFGLVLSGEELPNFWTTGPAELDHAFAVDGADPEEAFARWRAECARSREIAAKLPSLDHVGYEGETEFSLRFVLTHMIDEYARHAGHADLLRERIDGTTGV